MIRAHEEPLSEPCGRHLVATLWAVGYLTRLARTIAARTAVETFVNSLLVVLSNEKLEGLWRSYFRDAPEIIIGEESFTQLACSYAPLPASAFSLPLPASAFSLPLPSIVE